MKMIKFSRKPYIITILFTLLVFMTISSCKKDEVNITPSIDNIYPVSSVSKESLVKFLSITLGVQKSEITYISKYDEFIIRELKFGRIETEDHYKNANVYHATYGE